MSESGRTLLFFLLAQSVILTASTASAFQAPPEQKVDVKKAVPARIEPLRVINGKMQGRTVAGQFVKNGRQSDFFLTLTRAEVVGAKLELIGDFRTAQSSRRTQTIRAKIAGSMAMAANPWPHASDDDAEERTKKEPAPAGEQKQGREAKNPETAAQLGQLAQSTQDTARKTPPAPGKTTEKPRSGYDESEKISGCGVLFLSVELPSQLRVSMGAARPLQVGVVLAPLNNNLGEEINKRICTIVRMLDAKVDSRQISAAVGELTRVLATGRG
jgi:hypothetical protein